MSDKTILYVEDLIKCVTRMRGHHDTGPRDEVLLGMLRALMPAKDAVSEAKFPKIRMHKLGTYCGDCGRLIETHWYDEQAVVDEKLADVLSREKWRTVDNRLLCSQCQQDLPTKCEQSSP